MFRLFRQHTRFRPPSFASNSQVRWLFSGLFSRKTASVPALYKPRKERWITPTMVVVGSIPVFCFVLGTWQMQRLQWKINLIDELQEKLQLQPLSLPKKINLSVIPEFIWRRVVVRGKWDHAHTMLFPLRVREGVVGVHLVTPLIREDGSTILINRGFLSQEHAENHAWDRPEDEVEVFGMLRTSQPRNAFTPDNHPEEGIWYWYDVNAMTEYAGGEQSNVQPVYLEQIFEGHAGQASYCIDHGIPVGRPPTVDLRNSHLSYVITWYSLSALTAFMFLRLLVNRKQSNVRRLPRYG
ncbi:mitochondrial protein required for respiration [Armillaria luteobubalina]|uniref:SURF1-like protein n=1 Tax=Armillaria luteobubalina TaxID=153913 RepID=A0AA39QDN1_9AGAR|nr:mitochondrial protein required for respiration [Armillaria luteobubalina]